MTARVHGSTPVRFRGARIEHPDVARWAHDLAHASQARGSLPPSWLLVFGNVGTGKTHQAWATIAELERSVAHVDGWQFITAADLYARLQPRPRVDTEQRFSLFAQAPLLVIDDLGAAKPSAWRHEITHRLLDYRHRHDLPLLATASDSPHSMSRLIGARATALLRAKAERVVLCGPDRRRSRSPKLT